MVPTGINLYSQNTGLSPTSPPIVPVGGGAPTSSNVMGPLGLYPIGQRWIDTVGNAEYVLTSVTTVGGTYTANWVNTGGGSVELSTLTGNSGGAISPSGGNISILGAGTLAFAGSGSTLTGTITPGTGLIATLTGGSGGALSPTAGNFNILGTANQLTSIGSGSTITFSLPSAITAPGSLTTTTTLTAGTGITATTGDVTSTAGNFVVTAAAKGLVFTNSASTSGTTTATLNGRVGQVTITTPSIAGGATFGMTITNSAITGSSTQCIYALSGGTTGAALSIQSYANTAGQSVVTINNGTGATTNTASLILNFIVLN